MKILIILSLLLLSTLLVPPAIAQEQVIEIDSVKSTKEEFRVVDVQPQYPGGMKAFYKFVSKHMEYPTEAEENIVEGRVYVSFVIQDDGSLKKFEVLQGIGGGCDEEALRLVEAAGNWTPGILDGEAVKVRMQLPVIFRLPDRKKKRKGKS